LGNKSKKYKNLFGDKILDLLSCLGKKQLFLEMIVRRIIVLMLMKKFLGLTGSNLRRRILLLKL